MEWISINMRLRWEENKMSIKRILIAGGVSGLISLAADRAIAESIQVPENVNAVNIEQFQSNLRAPYDSLAVKVDRQKGEIRMAETTGDTTGLRGLRGRTMEDAERAAKLYEAIRAINDFTYSSFSAFNNAIRDSLVTAGEANNLLSKVELDQNSRDSYEKIAGREHYLSVDETVSRFNADVDTLLNRMGGAEEGAEAGSQVAERTEEEDDYTQRDTLSMDRLSYEAGVGYQTNERLNLALSGFYEIGDGYRLGITLGGELPEKDSDSETARLATQRNRITGTRLESAEELTRSVRKYALELLVNPQIDYKDFTFTCDAGAGRETTDRDSRRVAVETLYDRNDNVFGEPNVDVHKDASRNNELYVSAMAGLRYNYGNLGFGLQARTKSGSGTAGGTLTYRF